MNANNAYQGGASTAVRTPAVDELNQRLGSVQSTLNEAVGRVNMIANKVTGAEPPSEKAGMQPAAVPSCSVDWLNDIDRRLNDLTNAISRLD